MDDVDQTEMPDPTETPTDYPLEEVLREPAPRPVPAFFYESETYRKQKWTERGLLIAAGACMAAQFVPAIQAFSVYLLPLAYIGWLGVLFLLVYAGTFIQRMRGSGPLRYLTHGEPVVGEVLELVKKPTYITNDTEVHFAFFVTLRLPDPETGAWVTETIRSEDLPADAKARYRTSLRVGDLVTILYLPERHDAPYQLYGFLGLDPDVRYFWRDDRGAEYRDTLLAGLVVLGVSLIFAAFYVIARYEPLQFPVTPLTVSVISASIFTGLAAVLYLFWRRRRAHRQRAERNAEATASGDAIELEYEAEGVFGRIRTVVYGIAILAGIGMLCGVVSAAGLFFLNGFLDRANPEPVPVRIHERYTETHAMVFRQYKVKFALNGEEQVHTYTTSPETLARLRHVKAVALVKPGYLGWRWVAAIVPAPPGDDIVADVVF